jgi:hypothetical protein
MQEGQPELYVEEQKDEKRGYVIPLYTQNRGADYEHGFIDGMQHQMQSSVDRAVNAMSKREWVGLTDKEIDQGLLRADYAFKTAEAWRAGVEWATKELKEKNT